MILLTIAKIKNWLTHYWWALLFPIGIIVGIWIMLRDGSDAAKKVLTITKESHAKQKAALDKMEKETTVKREAVKKIHKKAISEIEAKHDAGLKDSKAATKKEIKRLSKEFRDNPEGLAKTFAEEFGLDLTGLSDE